MNRPEWVGSLQGHIFAHELERERTVNCTTSVAHWTLQPYLTAEIRANVVRWMSHTNAREAGEPMVLHHAVRMMDRYVAHIHIDAPRLQILALVCLWMADKLCSPKYVKLQKYIARVRGDKKPSVQECFAMERSVCLLLDGELLTPNMLSYVRWLMAAANMIEPEKQKAMFITRCSLACVDVNRFYPSTVACAVYRLCQGVHMDETAVELYSLCCQFLQADILDVEECTWLFLAPALCDAVEVMAAAPGTPPLVSKLRAEAPSIRERCIAYHPRRLLADICVAPTAPGNAPRFVSEATRQELYHTLYSRKGFKGQGTYGVVFNAYDNKRKHAVAIKKEKNEDDPSSGITPYSLREMDILRRLRDVWGIVHVFGVSIMQGGGPLHIVMERMDTNLSFWITSSFGLPSVVAYMAQSGYFAADIDRHKSVKSKTSDNSSSDDEATDTTSLSFGIVERSRYKFMASADCAQRNLSAALTGPQRRQHFSTVRRIMGEIVQGVAAMHRRGIMHRDLKPQNILCGSDGQWVRLCDFGSSLPATLPLGERSPVVTTSWYRSPEEFLGAVVRTFATDAWSLGCVLMEMLTGTPLFNGHSDMNTLANIYALLGTPNNVNWPGYSKLAHHHLLLPAATPNQHVPSLGEQYPNLPADACDFVTRALVYNPSRRATLEDMLAHPYLACMGPEPTTINNSSSTSEDVEYPSDADPDMFV